MILIAKEHKFAFLLLTGAFFFMILYKPTQTPPLGFDEGWTLSVARNWVEKGVYARYLNGEVVSAAPMVWPFTITVPIALSFKLFGIGAFQGRLSGAFYTSGALILLYFFCIKLYGKAVAKTTLIILLFMATHNVLHPILAGRTALGEFPLFFFLIAGYLFFWYARRNSYWFLLGAMVSWGLALITKIHPLPFWSASLLIPCVWAFYKRKLNIGTIFLLGWIGSIMFALIFHQIDVYLIDHFSSNGPAVEGLLSVGAFVLVPQVRLFALQLSLSLGLPVIVGIIYYPLVSSHRIKLLLNEDCFYERLGYYLLVISWLAWYIFLSIGWGRYLLPITFFGSIYIALMINNLTFGANLKRTIASAGGALKSLHFDKASSGALLAILVVVYGVGLNFRSVFFAYSTANDAVFKVAEYLNINTPPGALVETYESEQFFLLDRNYHYPPDQMQVDLNRWAFLGDRVSLNYDPLSSDPDFLILGPMNKLWGLYDSNTMSYQFRPVFAQGDYVIYERMR